ncbi:heavy-metal-associated domain-containing protein [Natrialbaceae archaeon AArc-T1-2]|uniref:heavy-metal-associated domain-containing protein n=1 Tax=Natrialbaceae archaeon AArc-T1-2 TaxID=3053904 RepID=UPI00255A73FF|nr:heavy-metal-associated domain-containing protein [Natrialbaceae archaeon AArc-T1-2]WIV67410.1 heavy-metal-associated domain-containing protein [Natrialbaceae archaeon AArc-T1-2]
MSQRSFQVEGMACAGCEDAVVDALTSLSGVEDAEANHETGSVTVDYRDDEGDAETIADAIENAGYDVAD